MISPEDADALAARLLGDLRTKLGGLHIAHARRVAAAVRGTGDDRAVAAALLHDVVEKNRITIDDLLAVTRDAAVVQLVEVLTQPVDEPYREYLYRCAADPTARLVKRTDLADKLVADDSDVTAAAAGEIRRQASERLALLEQLAEGLATKPATPESPGVPPARGWRPPTPARRSMPPR